MRFALLALLLLFGSSAEAQQRPRPGAPAAPPPDLAGTIPAASQGAFMETIADFRERSRAAPNDVARMTLLWSRGDAVRPSASRIQGWIGRVVAIYVVPGDLAGMQIALPDGTIFGTPQRPTERLNSALIRPGTAVFNMLVGLRQGEMVRFDATLFCETEEIRDCPMDGRTEPRLSLEEPRFYARITALRLPTPVP